MNKNELSEMQKALLDTFKAFAEFCKQNDIKYFAAYGTLIGAIRHKGFIPWDDDMDVYMLRPDYEKMMSLNEKLVDSSYRVYDYHTKGYPYEYAKFCDVSKTFIEFPQFPIVLGPFIDIFPLDEWSEDILECHKLYDKQKNLSWTYRKCISHVTYNEIFSNLFHFKIGAFLFKLGKKLIFNPQYKKIYRKINNLNEEKRNVRGDSYRVYTEPKNMRYEKKWFENTIAVTFEDSFIFVPSGYDECLTMRYGDYMKPPEPYERTGHHDAYYMNLEKRVEMDEILKLASDKVTPKSKMNLKVFFEEVANRFLRKKN